MSIISKTVAPEPFSLETKRRKLAQVIVCDGCCCGRTEKGRPRIPLERLKSEWKARKLLGTVQLTISGCLGPCDLANVVGVQTASSNLYLGGLTTDLEYEALLEWATRCTQSQQLEPLPGLLSDRQFEQFRIPESGRIPKSGLTPEQAIFIAPEGAGGSA